MIEILNEDSFAEKVLDSNKKVLVEFFATWCPHCQRMMPVINDVADRLEGKVKVYQVDVDKSPELAQTYDQDGFPKFILFEDGAAVDALLGEQPEEKILQLVA